VESYRGKAISDKKSTVHNPAVFIPESRRCDEEFRHTVSRIGKPETAS